MNKLETLRADAAYLQDEIEALDASAVDDDGEQRAMNDDETARFKDGVWLRNAIIAEGEGLQARHDAANVSIDRPGGIEAPQVTPPADKTDDFVGRMHQASRGEVRDAALRVLDERVESTVAQENGERLVRGSAAIARHVVQYGTEVYERAFAKLMAAPMTYGALLTPEEQRALAVGTGTSAGNMVPTHLDPTLLLSSAGSNNPFREVANVKTLPSPGANTYNALSTAGVTASWDAEAAEVSDDSPENAATAIATHKGAAFVKASFEAIEDVPGLESEILRLFADSKNVLEGAAFATGSGSAQPFGVFTALDADTNVEVANTTAATLGAVDVYGVYAAVPARFRDRSTWLMNIAIENTIRQLGTADPNFTVALDAAGIPLLFNKQVVESSDAPGTPSSTTQVENWLVVGDFQSYYIVDKVGAQVQYVPMTFHTSNNLPSGEAGWYLHWRTGADVVVNNAFRLLQDITSA